MTCPKSHSKAVQGGPGIWLLVAFQQLPPHQNPTSLNFLTLSPLTGVTSMSLKSLFLLLGKPFLPVPLPCFPLTSGLLQGSFGHPLLCEASLMLGDGLGVPKAEQMCTG